MPQTSYIPQLMDRVRAIIRCGAGRNVELACYLIGVEKRSDNPKRIQSMENYISSWLSGVRFPAGENTMRLRDWCAQKTLQISKSRKLASAYRSAFAETESGKAA